jgi:hypothetical protein
MATPEGALSDDSDDSITDEFLWWTVFEVGMPILILVVTWLFAQYAFDIHHPFLSIFGSGDLLPIVTLVLLGSSAETVHFIVFTTTAAARRTLSKHIAAQIVLVVLLAIAYGGIKGKGLQLLDGSELGSDAMGKLRLFSVVSMCMAFVALLLAFYSKNVLLALKVAAERRKK